MAVLELRGFGWRYARRRDWSVRGVDLRVEAGERVLLLGPSGAGKSTLLTAAAGLLPADSGQCEGQVLLDGVPVTAGDGRTGILLQDPATQLVMARAGDDVAFGLENQGRPPAEIWARVREVLDQVGFGYPLDRDTGALSGGEQQRLALAGALATRPGLLLLDEPTANLDPAGAAMVRAGLARALADRSSTLLLVEHRVEQVLDLVDRVVVLEPGGGVRADGPPDQVFAAYGTELAAAGVWVPGRAQPPRHQPRPAGDQLLAAAGLGFGYPGASAPALTGVDLTVAAGQCLAVLGPSGGGKSTLALLLGGLLRPGGGTVTATAALAGPAHASRPPHTWPAPVLVGAVGSVFQNPSHQFVTGRVRAELAVGPRRTGRSAAETNVVVDELLDRLRLAHLAEANPHTLSGGERRRLSVATALATAPELLVLDEPTFGQDARTWRETVALLADLVARGRGLVTVTHDTDLVAAVADRVVRVAGGRLTEGVTA